MATYGYTFQSGDGVTPTRLNDARTISAIVNADISDDTITNAKIKSDAAIAHSKLANITAGQVLLGNASNVPTATALTGDVTVTSGGVTAIGSAKVLPAMLSQPFTLATAQNSTSGTSIDFTSIPSWAKRITVMFDGVSTNGTSVIIFQLSTGGVFVTTGYSGSAISFNTTTAAGDNYTNVNGIRTRGTNAAANSWNGQLTLMTMGSNRWITSGNFETTDGSGTGSAGITFSHVLSGALDGVRVTTANGTDTFDAGVINIAYEG